MIVPTLFDTQLPLNDAQDLPYFYPMDTLSLYNKNLVDQPGDWAWRDRSIRYTLNQQGYRCSEFDQVDWSQSILCFGCSITFGVGVDDCDTWPSQLAEITGVPTVNLGVAGGSIQINWANSVKLIAAGVRPRAVVYYWPDPSRSCEFRAGQTVVNWGGWLTPVLGQQQVQKKGYLGTAWLFNSAHHTVMTQLMMQSIEWSGTRLDYTWSTEQIPGAQFREGRLDLARDQHHPGAVSHREFALSVARDLKI